MERAPLKVARVHITVDGDQLIHAAMHVQVHKQVSTNQGVVSKPAILLCSLQRTPLTLPTPS